MTEALQSNRGNSQCEPEGAGLANECVRLSRRRLMMAAAAGLGGLLAGLRAMAWEDGVPADWTTAFPPHRIISNVHYVGSRDLAAFLITTPKGHILINSNLASSPALIRTSVEKLGFRYHDIKILLISHGHYDHCAGSAQIVRETGAQYMVMDADVAVVADGGRSDFRYGTDKSMWFPPAKVAHVLHDGETVKLGDAVLTAHKTAGHTKGCTTWTMEVHDGLLFRADQEGHEGAMQGGDMHPYQVVIVGSPNVNPGFNLIHDAKYPGMALDFAKTFATLKELPCDVFLGAHGGYYGMLEKHARQEKGDRAAFLDPDGYRAYVAERQAAFEKELAKQKAVSAGARKG
jgi:metallo-beta-lactamase class B